MSKKNRLNSAASTRHSRAPRPHPNAEHSDPSGDERRLASLGYQKGHLTPEELALFGELRGLVSKEEVRELKAVSRTLRRPLKRLRALDLLRFWGAPLTQERRRMLPWLAGLQWHRELPQDRSMPTVSLARHLLEVHPAPSFLLEPFARPDLELGDRVIWELCRLYATVASGEGLAKLREIQPFWDHLTGPVFERFLESPPGTPVLEALVDAHVKHWGGPEWLASEALSWTQLRSLRFGLPPILRVVYELCVDPVPRAEARSVALARLEVLNERPPMFGETVALSIPNVLPPEIDGWEVCELRTPADFEAADAVMGRSVHRYFNRACRGELSIWWFHREERAMIAQVDPERMHMPRYFWSSDEERDGVGRKALRAWAEANGLGI